MKIGDWIKRNPGRKPISIGPIRINTSDFRPTSLSVVFRRWRWNSRKPTKVTYDHPGPGSVELGPDRPRTGKD